MLQLVISPWAPPNWWHHGPSTASLSLDPVSKQSAAAAVTIKAKANFRIVFLVCRGWFYSPRRALIRALPQLRGQFAVKRKGDALGAGIALRCLGADLGYP